MGRPPQTKRKKKQGPLKVIELESLKQLNLNAAGLDIGVAEIWACVGRRPGGATGAHVPHHHPRSASLGRLAREL